MAKYIYNVRWDLARSGSNCEGLLMRERKIYSCDSCALVRLESREPGESSKKNWNQAKCGYRGGEVTGEIGTACRADQIRQSQAMIEMKDAKRSHQAPDDEIHKRVKDALSQSRKLYEAHKYKEAVAALEESTKLGSFEALLPRTWCLATTNSEIATRRWKTFDTRRSPTRLTPSKN